MTVILTDEQRENVAKLAPYLSKKFIADFLGIHRETFNAILERDEELGIAYKKGKAQMIAKATKTLTQKMFGDEENPPDTACLLFFLKTQTEGDYRETRDSSEIEIEKKTEKSIEIRFVE